MKRWVMLSVLLLSQACSATKELKPVSEPDRDSPCLAGSPTWDLQVTDQRASPRDSAQLIGLVKDSLSRSLPGCRFTTGTASPTITIEIHRFSAKLDGVIWDAAADWSVLARDASGQTLTEFDCTFEQSRPNYRSSDNEKALLQEVFELAMRRTLKGLHAMGPV